MLDQLVNPEIKYRPYNYWGWLENIEPDEVKRQVGEMSKAGLGGYVMHARGGLLIPYMGEQWLDSVNAMIEEGTRLGMATIIDDEDGWPSGFGAGKVNGKGEEFWLKWLECKTTRLDELETSDCTLGVYTITENTIHRIQDLSQLKAADEIIHIYYDSSRYYVDNLNPKVVNEFIEASYEEYYSKFSNEFGTGINAIFSDEPQIARDRITWSWIIPEQFQTRFGYDLLEVLPAIYYNADGCEKVRYDFWKLVSRLFTESYSKQIGNWCGEHNISLMGHTAEEDGLARQMMSSGSTMPFYEYIQVPGIDWLCRIPVNNMTVKQVTSVAQQLGKERILSEMYGCAGWNVSFEELKWIGEWHYVLGINFMLQHLGLYSLRGSRKREYPASLFYQQPWWGEFKPFNDYFAKLSKLMSESKPLIDVLVIHPMSSAWVAFQGKHHGNADHIEGEFQQLTANLLNLNYDFHYGDEEIMLKHGRVEGSEIAVGQASYKAVIIPPSLSLDSNTMNLLTQFAHNGGKIISLGAFPHLIAGAPGAEIEKLKQHAVCVENTILDLEGALSKAVSRAIHIMNCDGSRNEHVYCCTRETGEETVYYIVNTSRERGYEFNIKLKDEGSICKFNLVECSEEFLTDLNHIFLEPTESMILLSRAKAASPSLNVKNNNSLSHNKISLDGEWDVVRADNNSITLDYCRYSIESGPWEEEIPVILLQEKLVSLGRPVDVSMKFEFMLDFKMKSKLFMVIEEPDEFDIIINGKQLVGSVEGWWIDKSFNKIAIEDLVHFGVNEIILNRHFYCSDKVYKIKSDTSIHEAESNRVTIDTELESIYLLGDFSVNLAGSVRNADKRALFVEKSFKLSEPKEKVQLDNLVTQGYPFFAGSISLSKKFNLNGISKGAAGAELVLDRPDSIVTRVSINGEEVNTFLWAPYKADITGLLREGVNEITVEMVNSSRNLLGPHHHSDGELYAVGPYSYKDSAHWTDEYCFVRLGLSGLAIHL